MMNISETPAAILAFFEKSIMPQIPSTGNRWLTYFGLMGYMPIVQQTIEKHKPMLTSCGVIDENGNVNLEKLEQFGNATFEKVPEALIGDFGVTKTEFTEFINFIKGAQNI
jgi:hypothetical protein